jgi:hypothetical protein
MAELHLRRLLETITAMVGHGSHRLKVVSEGEEDQQARRRKDAAAL